MFKAGYYLSAFFLLLFVNSCSFYKSEVRTYQFYKGFIGSIPITMHLHKDEHQFSGVYFYDKIGKPILVLGEDTSSVGNIILKSFGNDGASETLILKQDEEKISGTWISEKKENQNLPVVLNAVNEKLDFEYFAADSTYALKNGDDDASCTYKAAFIWPKWNDAFSDVIKKDIQKSFSDEGAQLVDPKSFIIRDRDNYISGYISMMDSIKNEIGYLESRQFQNIIQLIYQSKNVLCTNTSFYQYDGGAHGMSGDLYSVYDVKQKRKISINEVITSSGFRNLPNLIEKQIKKGRGVSSYGSIEDAGMFEEGVEKVTENFYVTDKGIGFVYLPYEIGPYAAGQFDVFLSYDMIQKYLQPSFIAMVIH